MLNVPSHNGSLQFATIKSIEHHQKQHNTPCCSITIYHLLKKHAKGGINIFEECKGKGNPQICSDDDIKEIAQSWELEVGKTYDKLDDVKLMLNKKQAAYLEKAGLKNIIERSICEKIVTNYAAMLANEGTIAISQSYINKSNTWYAAENSI